VIRAWARPMLEPPTRRGGSTVPVFRFGLWTGALTVSGVVAVVPIAHPGDTVGVALPDGTSAPHAVCTVGQPRHAE